MVLLNRTAAATQRLSPTPTGRRWHAPLTWLALLTSAWVVPAVTHLVRVDWLLPPIVLVATASLLRGSRRFIDRLFVALGLLVGATCAAGLLFSVWPWHLHPLPIGGLALTALVAVSLATGRRPEFGSGRALGADVGLMAGALVPFAVAVHPFLGSGLARCLDLVMLGEDLSRLYNAYDAIRAIGGYPFFHPDIGGVSLSSGMVHYPAGSTFVAATLDSFVRSSTTQGAPASAFTHFVMFFVLTFGVFGACVVWAADWVARPFLHGARRVLVVCIASAACAFSTLFSMFVSGFFSSALGLALLALLFAVLARPWRMDREYVVVVAALTVGLAFVYYLFLPVALAAIAYVAFSRRLRLRRTRLLTLGATVLVAAPLVATPVLVTFGSNPESAGEQVVLPGTAVPTDHNGTLAAVLIVLVGAVARWRLPTARRTAMAMVAMTLFTVGIGAYSITQTSALGHYFNKSTQALLVACLVFFGLPVSLVRVPDMSVLRRRVVAALIATTTFVGFGLVPIPALTAPAGTDSVAYRVPPAQTSWGAAFTLGQLRVGATLSGAVVRTLHALPDGYDRPTVVVDGAGAWQSYLATKFVSVLRRDGNSVDNWAVTSMENRSAAQLIAVARSHPDARIRFVLVDMPRVAAELQAFATAHPRYGLTIVAV